MNAKLKTRLDNWQPGVNKFNIISDCWFLVSGFWLTCELPRKSVGGRRFAQAMIS